MWEDDNVQFVRLLAEINAIGLTEDQVTGLAASMDLPPERIDDLLQRAEDAFERLKRDL